MIRPTANSAALLYRTFMLISTSAITLDSFSFTSFLLKVKSGEMFVDRPEGQPLFLFSKRRSPGILQMWGFGFEIIINRNPYRVPSESV
jgi:hypothetical protein